ncbi:hypothetical protein Slin14017_G128930 [Septoria linicola]|nr:hypothetical protein Slin14017_G128930 [Septoria linicola]
MARTAKGSRYRSAAPPTPTPSTPTPSAAAGSEPQITPQSIVQSFLQTKAQTFDLLHKYWWQRFTDTWTRSPELSPWRIHARICDDFDNFNDAELRDALADTCIASIAPQNRHTARNLSRSSFWAWDLFSVCAIFGEPNCKRCFLESVVGLSHVYTSREDALRAMLIARHERLAEGRPTKKSGQWRQQDVNAAYAVGAKTMAKQTAREQTVGVEGAVRSRTSAGQQAAEKTVVEDGTAPDEAAEDETAEDETAEDETAEDETAEDEIAEDETAEDETAEDEAVETDDDDCTDSSQNSAHDPPAEDSIREDSDFLERDRTRESQHGRCGPRPLSDNTLVHSEDDDDLTARFDVNQEEDTVLAWDIDDVVEKDGSDDSSSSSSSRGAVPASSISSDVSVIYLSELDSITFNVPPTHSKQRPNHNKLFRIPPQFNATNAACAANDMKRGASPTMTGDQARTALLDFQKLARARRRHQPTPDVDSTMLEEWLRLFPDTTVLTAPLSPCLITKPTRYCILFNGDRSTDAQTRLLAVALLRIEHDGIFLEHTQAEDHLHPPSPEQIVEEVVNTNMTVKLASEEATTISEENLHVAASNTPTSLAGLIAMASFYCGGRTPHILLDQDIYAPFWFAALRAIVHEQKHDSLQAFRLPSALSFCQTASSRFVPAQGSRRQTDHLVGIGLECARLRYIIAELREEIVVAEGLQRAAKVVTWVLGRLLRAGPSGSECTTTAELQADLEVKRRTLEFHESIIAQSLTSRVATEQMHRHEIQQLKKQIATLEEKVQRGTDRVERINACHAALSELTGHLAVHSFDYRQEMEATASLIEG